MSPVEQREEALFEAALKLPAAERAAYLNQACAGDAELRRRVELLISAFERAGGFLNQPVTPLRDNLSPTPTEKPGDRIGRYRLLEQIGEGGCGVVYVAEQEEPVRRRVALKIIKLGMDTKQVIARFEAERQALAMMDHPNIAKIYDAGATDARLVTSHSSPITSAGRPYFVMELVRGVKITDYCEQNGISLRERLDLFIQVCRAIQHAHQKGIIHRDIKPSNILVTVNDGVAVLKVIDFGIAKATQSRLSDQTVYTAFEQFIGTPAYMSPEQAVMTSLDIDTRSDIYSLGVLLYELLTGTTPFDAKELLEKGLDEMRRTIREVEPVKPSTRLTQRLGRTKGRKEEAEKVGKDSPPHALSTLNHQLSTDLDWIVMKCLEKDRARRYETANGLAADLQRHLDHEPVLARPPSYLYFFQKLVRRHCGAAVTAGITTLAFVLTIVVLAVSNTRIRHMQGQKDKALAAALNSEQESRHQLIQSLKSQAKARRNSRQIGQRTESLKAIADAARLRADEDLRDIAIAALALPDISLGPAWQAFAGDEHVIAFDSSYSRYARAEPNAISIRSLPDDDELQRLRLASALQPLSDSSERAILFSPDGQYLARLELGYHWRVCRLPEDQEVMRVDAAGCSVASFASNSKHLAIGRPRELLILDLESGKELQRWAVPSAPISIAFSPGNLQLAVACSEGPASVSIFNLLDSEPAIELPVSPSNFHVVAWHPDGKLLAVSVGHQIEVWDPIARVRVASLGGHAQAINDLSFNPAGNYLVSASWDGTPRLWHPTPGREWLRIIAGRSSLRFSDDGRWAGAMWTQNGDAHLLEVVPSRAYHTFIASRHDIEHAFHQGDISADGTLLALGSVKGVSLRELPTGRELAWLPTGYAVGARFIGTNLVICGITNLEAWPVTSRESGRVRIGPPSQLPAPVGPLYITSQGKQSAVGILSESTGEVGVIDLPTYQMRKPSFRHDRATICALSPDAQWLATAGWRSERVRVWNVLTGELVLNKHTGRARLFFTPDGRELIVAHEDAFTFYSTTSWQVTRQITREAGLHPGFAAFAPDGKLMALETTPAVIQLMDVSTGRVVARLEDPHSDTPVWMQFTPDGKQLIVAAEYARAIHRWDLGILRSELKSMGLDWDWPEFSPSVRTTAPPLKVEVIAAD